MAIAHAYFRAHRLARIIQSDPVDAGRREFVAQQLFLMSGDNLILQRIDSDDVQWLRFGDAEAAALSDGVVMNTSVLADDGAAWADDLAGAAHAIGFVFRFKVAVDETGIVAIGNKTNLLRLGLLSHGEFVAPRRRARIRL